MTKRRYDNIEELEVDRKELDSKFESGLPDYLVDFFDDKEQKIYNKEYFKQLNYNKITARTTFSSEERRAYMENKYEEFWKENKAEIKKKPRTVPSHLEPVFTESPKATERVQQEVALTDEERKALIYLSSQDLYVFAIRYFPHYLKKPSSKLHKFLYKTLSRNIVGKKKFTKDFKIAIAAPRGSGKSSLVSCIFPIWCLCFGYKKYIIVVSDTAGQAEDFLSDIKREIEFNELLKRDFPFVCGKGPIWRQDEIVTNNDIKLAALGTGSKIRGRRYGVFRPSLVILDDCENDDMVRSESAREFIRHDWFNKGVLHVSGEEGSGTDFLVIGTVLGKESLLNALLDPEQYPDWRSYKFRAVEEFSDSPLWDEWKELITNRFDINRLDTAKKFFEDNKDEMLEGTRVLWPEGNPYYNNMVVKISDISAFYSEYQNDPLDPSKILVTRDEMHFERFTSPEIKKILESRGRVDYFAGFDPSLGKKKTADYSCLTTVARDKKTGYIYVVDFDIARRTVDEQIELILKKYEEYLQKILNVETNGFQVVLEQNLVKESRRRGLLIPINPVQNYSDKHMRLQSIVPLIKDGTIVFDSGKESANKKYALALEQIYEYSEGARHDDAFDSLELAIRACRKLRFKLLTKVNR